jgi:hypothetical protein
MAWQAIASGASSAAGGYHGAASGYLAAQQAAADMKYQASLSRARASLLGQQSAAAQAKGISTQTQIGLSVADTLGKGMGGYAAGNVELGSGSAAAFEIDTASLGAIDRETAAYNTALDVWGFENEAIQLKYEAGMMDKIAKKSRRMARLNMYMGLLTASGGGFNAYQSAGGKTGPSASVTGGQTAAPASSSSGQ